MGADSRGIRGYAALAEAIAEYKNAARNWAAFFIPGQCRG